MGDGHGATTAEPAARREGLDPTLLEILACPDDKQPVIYQKEGDAERLTCTKCGKRYPVRDGIPVMLIDEATPGPVPTEADIAAAKAMAPQGKPAIVGAAGAT
ncbi:MAG: Trm112 family protein, partial [Chloroflexota bacterium]